MKSITLIFGGAEYFVSENDAWGLIEAVEEVVSIAWLAPRLSDLTALPMVRIYRAYAAALNYAGAKNVTLEAIRAGVNHQRFYEMAIEIFSILNLASPPHGAELGSGEINHNPEAAKKKPSRARQKPASNRG